MVVHSSLSDAIYDVYFSSPAVTKDVSVIFIVWMVGEFKQIGSPFR
jgi:hypothetical protein